MNRDVYSYLLKTYGRESGYWAGFVLIIVQTLLLRVVAFLFIAHLAGNLATGNIDAAKRDILFYLAISVLGLACRFARDMLAYRAENKAYRSIVVNCYKRIVAKDMSFFRDHQTGYLASLVRQHADSAIDLARLLRIEVIQTTITMIIPVTVLIIASRKVGLAALGIIMVQIAYVLWSSSTANHYRVKSHEAYRKLSGAISDDITNIVAYKTSGVSKAATVALHL